MGTEVLGTSILVDRYPYNGASPDWPVVPDDLKRHVQIEHDEDDLLLQFGSGGYLAAAVENTESRGQVSLMYQKRKQVLDELPADRAVHIIRGPLVSVTSVTYLDGNDAQQTLDPSYYRALAAGRGSCIYFKSTTASITVADGPGVVTINCICGMGDQADKIPAAWRQIVAEMAAYFYERRDGVAGGGIDEAMEVVFDRKIQIAGGIKRYV